MATSAIKSVTLFTSTKQVSVLLTVYSSKGSRHGRRKKRTSWQLCLPITHTHSSNKIYATMRLCWLALTATFKLGGSWQLLDFATIYIIQVYKIYALLINHLLLSCNNIQKTSILDSSKNPKYNFQKINIHRWLRLSTVHMSSQMMVSPFNIVHDLLMRARLSSKALCAELPTVSLLLHTQTSWNMHPLKMCPCVLRLFVCVLFNVCICDSMVCSHEENRVTIYMFISDGLLFQCWKRTK